MPNSLVDFSEADPQAKPEIPWYSYLTGQLPPSVALRGALEDKAAAYRVGNGLAGPVDYLSTAAQIPNRLVQNLKTMAVSGATLPGDAVAGRTPVTDSSGMPSDEAIRRSMDLTGLMASGSFAKAPAGALGSGPVRAMPKGPTLEDLMANNRLPRHMDQHIWDTYGDQVDEILLPEAQKLAKDKGISLDDAQGELANSKGTKVIEGLMRKDGGWEELLSHLDEIDEAGGLQKHNDDRRQAVIDAVGALKGKPASLDDVQKALEEAAANPSNRRPKGVTLNASGDKSTSALIASSERPAPMFYSAAQQALSKMPLKTATSEQWLGTLRNAPGLKGEELENAERFLVGRAGQQVSKDELAAHIEQSTPQIKEVVKSSNVKQSEQTDYDDFFAETAAENPGISTNEIDDMWEELYSQESGDTKFKEYQLPGGENYREVLMTLPPKEPLPTKSTFALYKDGDIVAEGDQQAANRWRQENGMNEGTPRAARYRIEERKVSDTTGYPSVYQSSHWDEPNVLAHLRMNDRLIPDEQGLPQKTLFAEELQSDWHQAGRKKGYNRGPDNTKIDEYIDDFGEEDLKGLHGLPKEASRKEVRDAVLKDIKNSPQDYADWEDNLGEITDGVPDAPFKKTWPELLLKRMVREAAEKGYDQIAWTDGATQAARYDLSKQVDAVKAFKQRDGSYDIWVKQKGGGIPTEARKMVKEEQLPDVVGKDLAEKIVKDGGGEYSGLDLQVGGEGMAGFYDKILPSTANKLFGKLGGKVEKRPITTPGEIGGGPSYDESGPTIRTVHVLKITPELRKHAIEKGFPLFSSGLPIAGGDQPEYTGRVKLTPVSHDPFAGVKNAR